MAGKDTKWPPSAGNKTTRSWTWALADRSGVRSRVVERNPARQCSSLGCPEGIAAASSEGIAATRRIDGASLSDKMAAHRMGHASVTITKDRYTHVTEAAILEATARLNEYYAERGRGVSA